MVREKAKKNEVFGGTRSPGQTAFFLQCFKVEKGSLFFGGREMASLHNPISRCTCMQINWMDSIQEILFDFFVKIFK